MSNEVPADNSNYESVYAALPPSAAAIARELELTPLEHEGGFFRNMLATEHSSAIYFMVAGNDFSALHWLAAPEVYHWYAGAPLELLVLHPDGTAAEITLGPEITAGQRPQFVVPAGCVHGSSSAGEWTLVGTTMAPAFSWDNFRLVPRAEALESHPACAARITELTRV